MRTGHCHQRLTPYLGLNPQDLNKGNRDESKKPALLTFLMLGLNNENPLLNQKRREPLAIHLRGDTKEKNDNLEVKKDLAENQHENDNIEASNSSIESINRFYGKSSSANQESITLKILKDEHPLMANQFNAEFFSELPPEVQQKVHQSLEELWESDIEFVSDDYPEESEHLVLQRIRQWFKRIF